VQERKWWLGELAMRANKAGVELDQVGVSPAQVVRVSELVNAAIAASTDIAAKIRNGKTNAVGALLGDVMRATGGRADAARARELILRRLS
jgi:aspartyl-tRNA(Asn)/glutamyl-tRNA(Gln) amidotransferase subunit B